MRVEQDRDQHDGVAEEDRDQRLPPVHARADQTRRKHVRRDAVRHADPKRGVVVSGPVAPRDGNGREIAIVESAVADFFEGFGTELYTSVGVLDDLVSFCRQRSAPVRLCWGLPYSLVFLCLFVTLKSDAGSAFEKLSVAGLAFEIAVVDHDLAARQHRLDDRSEEHTSEL